MAKNSQNPINEGYERRDGAQKTTSGKPVRPAPATPITYSEEVILSAENPSSKKPFG